MNTKRTRRAYNWHGLRYEPEHYVFQMARQRCVNPKARGWKWNGAKGIRFRFASLPALIYAIGRRPCAGYRLQRIDREKDYAPGNVFWKPPKRANEQSKI